MIQKTDAEKQAEREYNAQMRDIGRDLGIAASELVEQQLWQLVQEEFTDVKLPELASDARGRLVYAFSCAMADELDRQLARLADTRKEPEAGEAAEASQSEGA